VTSARDFCKYAPALQRDATLSTEQTMGRLIGRLGALWPADLPWAT